MEPSAWLFHGPPGSGKSFTATTGFTDHNSNTPSAEGVWIKIGTEDNPRIQLPPTYMKRYVAEPGKELAWVKDLKSYLIGLYEYVRSGHKLGAVVFDGITEFVNLYLYSWARRNVLNDNTKWTMYDEMKAEAQAVLALLNPVLLDCHIIFTARVTERKKGVTNKQTQVTTGADPEYVVGELIPAADGWLRKNIGYMFPIVLAFETFRGKHRVLLTLEEGYQVKNPWEDVWKKRGLPSYLDNPHFADIETLFDKATEPEEKHAAN